MFQFVKNAFRPSPGQLHDHHDNSLEYAIEPLEDRKMLAGNVAVELNAAGDVNFEGDDQANQISIVNTPNGLYVEGTSDTTITFEGVTANSHLLRSGPVDGVDRDLNFAMHKGDDLVEIDGVHVGRHIKAQMGQGNDALVISNSQTTQNLYVNDGTGRFADYVRLDNVQVGRLLNVNVGDAPNDECLDTFHQDTIEVTGSTVGTNMKLVGKRGFTSVHVFDVEVTGKTRVFTGDGEDTITIADSKFEGTTTINAGGRNDFVSLIGAIETEGVFQTFLGNGDDVLYMDTFGSDFGGRTKLTGNQGFDILQQDSGILDDDAEVIQFEEIL